MHLYSYYKNYFVEVCWQWLKLCFLSCYLFGIIPNKAFAQQPYLKQFSFAEGLPSNTVYAVYQDQKGYIWFATDLGVCRYNGYEIEHFTTKNGMPDVEVFGFYEDSQARLWFRTFNGKLGYYKDGVFYNEERELSLRLKKPIESFITAIADYDGEIHIMSLRGRWIQLDSTNQVVGDTMLSNSVQQLHFRNQKVWMPGPDVFRLYNVETLQQTESILYNSHTDYTYIRADLYQNHWLFSANNQLRMLSFKDKTVTVIDSFPVEIIAIHTIGELIWVGTRDGAYLVKIEADKSMTILTHQLSGKAVTSICRDFEGGLWFSTLNAGVYYDYNTNLKVVYSIEEERSDIGVITALTVGPDQRKWLCFSKNQYSKGDFQTMEKAVLSQTKQREVRRVAFIEDEVWVMGGNLAKKVEEGTKHLNNQPVYIPYAIKSILLDQEGYYVIGGSSYLLRIPKERINDLLRKREMTSKRIPKEFILTTNRINYLHQDGQGDIWGGTNKGLLLLNKDGLESYRFKGRELGSVKHICSYDDRTILVSTNSKGIWVIRDRRVIQRISVRDGLNAANIFECLVTAEQSIWINTAQGLNLLTGLDDSLVIRDMSFELGLQREKIVDLALEKQTLLLATPHRVLAYTSTKSNHAQAPLLLVNDVLVNNQAQSSGKLELAPHQNSIRIKFTGLSYKNNKAITYQYKLEGAGNQWVDIDGRSLSLDALSAGDYTLKIKAINTLGSSSKVWELAFTVVAPFYTTTWFILVLFLLSVFIIVMAIRWQIGRLEKKHAIEQQIIISEKKKAELEGELRALEQQALRLQMNPHFIFNALNTIKGYYSSENIQKANTYIAKFSRLLRIILEHKERTIPLLKEKELLELYLKLVMLRYETDFGFDFIIGEGINSQEATIPSMLLQPFVENAIIHGISTMLKDGHILILIERVGKELHCTVRDNGIGREAAKERAFHKESRVNAIDIIKRRLELIQEESGGKTSIAINDLYNEQQQAVGTEVVLTLPYEELW